MERLLAAIAQPLIFKQMELALSASVGAASAPEDGLDPETLLEKADQAMYLMKRKGKKTTRTDYFPPGSGVVDQFTHQAAVPQRLFLD